MRLSHVSRRFRQSLWKNAIYGQHCAQTLRKRNRRRSIREAAHLQTCMLTFTWLPTGKALTLTSFTKTFWSKISRWKTLSLTDCARGFEGQWKGTYSESVTIMHGILKACNGVQFPRLEELYILGRTADSSSEAIIWRILDVSEPTLF